MPRLFRAGSGDPKAGDPGGLDVGALAPMVDMMTLLLVFLLRTWSQDAAPAAEAGFELVGTRAGAPRRAGGTEVMITQEAVWLDGVRVTAIRSPDGGPDAPADDLIRPLYDRLLPIRDKGVIAVYADRRLPCGALRRVLQTARAAGFEELSIVAASEAGL